MCNELLSPRDDAEPSKNVGDFVASCDLYLMDVITKKLLPNRHYRIINPISGKAILGTSSSDGKIQKKFKYAHVEILPVNDKKYEDDAIIASASKLINQTLWRYIEVGDNLVINSPGSLNTSAPLPIMNGVNTIYMDWLRDKMGADPWPEHNSATMPPYQYSINGMRNNGISITEADINSVEFTGSPSVPKRAVLIGVNDLMGGFKSKGKGYAYLNSLEMSTLPSDMNISSCFMHHINSGNLPSHYFYVLGHGNTTVLAGYDDSGSEVRYYNDNRSLRALLMKMESNGYSSDKTVIFLACHLGNGVGSFAEKFSQIKGVGTVYAFTGFGWFGGTRPFWCAGGYTVNYKKINAAGTEVNRERLIPTDKVNGHWRIFNTATAAIKS
ncbi:hypothetical protein [Serratia silvae]|uniref:Peptidase C80 domain-containing protein n=1 Tax=Serratia silvae TaxID=2824122 RepID=A0ABT0KBL7_9GAMM|nr:hypothetical protein [Serratia silvae]MCL1029418.1 hypothetical protein [Serratia silvae]